MKKYLLTIIISLIYFGNIYADTIIVDCNGGGHYLTIQAGIDAANDEDTVLVYPGTYYENINYLHKNIIIGSLFLTTYDTSYVSLTTIDGNGSQVVSLGSLGNNPAYQAVLTGFTIQNGGQIGIGCGFGSQKISYNHIVNNSTGIKCIEPSGITMCNNFISDNDLGIECIGGITMNRSPGIVGNTIQRNESGILCWNSSPIIIDNIIYGNSFYGISCFDLSSPEIVSNFIIENGNGIECFVASYPSIDQNTISKNDIGVYFNSSGPGIAGATIRNSIIYGNLENNFGCYVSALVYVSYCCIGGELPGWINDSGGNIYEDPLFVDPDNNDYSLFQDSPCIDVGDPNSEPDPDGTCADMGYFSAKIDKHTLSAEHINWTSLPKLNKNNADAMIVFQELIDNGNLEKVIYDYGKELWKDTYGNWHNDIGDLKTVHGYRVKMYEQDTLFVYGYKTDPDTTRITLYPGALPDPPKWNWIGYFLEEDMSVTDAFPPEVYSKIASIKSDNWCIYRPIDSDYWRSGKGVVQVKGRAGAMKYAHSYGVRLGNTVEDTLRFVWGQEITEEVVDFVKAPTEYFAYEAKADYMPIFIDSTEALNGIEEIGVFLEDECIGASKAEDGFPLFVPSYTEDEPFRWREYEELTFQVVTYGKNETRGIQVFVYNELQDAFVQEPVILDNNSYAVVRLGTGEGTELPREFTLYQNYPNPITSSTTISFIPSPGVERSAVKIYNLRGQLVKTIVPVTNDKCPMTKVVWSGKDDNGRQVGNGIYFYKVIAGKKSAIKKMVLLR